MKMACVLRFSDFQLESETRAMARNDTAQLEISSKGEVEPTADRQAGRERNIEWPSSSARRRFRPVFEDKEFSLAYERPAFSGLPLVVGRAISNKLRDDGRHRGTRAQNRGTHDPIYRGDHAAPAAKGQ
jgi:hypothetical protein